MTLAATTGTAGNFGVTIGRPLLAMCIGSNSGGITHTFLDGSIPEILSGACLSSIFIPAVTTASPFDLWFEMLEA